MDVESWYQMCLGSMVHSFCDVYFKYAKPDENDDNLDKPF